MVVAVVVGQVTWPWLLNPSVLVEMELRPHHAECLSILTMKTHL